MNAALAVVCIGGTIAVRRRSAPAPVKLEEAAPRAEDGRKTQLAPAAAQKERDDAKAPARGLPAGASLDELWQNTLFLPERTEREAGSDGMTPEEAARAAQLAAQKIEFELIGIAQMALPGRESEPVAVLRNKVSAGRPGGRPVPGGRPMPGRTMPAASVASTAPAKQVFRVGEKINETGYAVKAIDAAARVVEVVRGSEVVTLTINFASSEANLRRNVAVQDALRKRNEEAAAQARAQAAVQQEAIHQAAVLNNGAAPVVPSGTAVPVRPGTPGAAATSAASSAPPGPPGVTGGASVNNTAVPVYWNGPAGYNGGASGMSGRPATTAPTPTTDSQAERQERVRRAVEARQRAAQQR